MKISSAWKKLVIFLLGPVFLAIPGTILGDQWWEIFNPEVVIKIEPMAVLGTLQNVKARGKLVVGVKPDSPPLSFVDRKGANQGLEIDIAKNLAKKLFGTDKAVEFVSVTSESRIPLLIWGMVDVVAATLTITEEGKREVDFSTPYFVTG